MASLTDIGFVRKMNQDSLAVLVADQLECSLDGLFVVADGMGGKAGGEIASRVTVETVPDVVQEILADHTHPVGTEALAEALREALEAANDAVYTQARANPELRGMGTTCVAAMVLGGQAIIGNVGDSRAYLLRERRLTQITSDHSLVQEHVRAGELTPEQARGSRFKNVITRAIGIASSVDPDIDVMEMKPGDTLLLCSDGLTNMVSEGEIGHILGTFEDLDECCRRLVDAAKKNGGIDNITTVVIRHGAFNRSAQPDFVEMTAEPSVLQRPPTTDRRRRGSRSGALATLLVLVTIALIMVAGEVYEFAPRWPFIERRPPEKQEVATPAPLDFAKLTYGEPVLLTNKPVRGGVLVCSPDGTVFVVSAQSRAVLRVTPGGTVSTLASADLAPTVTRTDRFLATDPQGNIYVSSPASRSVVKYDRSGTRIGTIGASKLKSPQAIGVDAKGNIYVVDGSALKVLRVVDGATGEAPGESGGGGQGVSGGLSVEAGSQRPDDLTTQRPGARDGTR